MNNITELKYSVNSKEVLNELKTSLGNIKTYSNDENSTEWEYEGELGTISGTIGEDSIPTMTYGPAKYMAIVVNTFRKVIPEQYTLYIFHLGEPIPLIVESTDKVGDTDFVL
ncbi:MAG: hypothetical protein AAFY41_11470 [Bacteroidota bacterium]